MKKKGRINIRAKGAKAERDIVAFLTKVSDRVHLEKGLDPPRIERNQQQTNLGGYDIIGIDWMALEVKHQESFEFNAWWRQTMRQAKEWQVPVLVYRKNHVKFRVRMLGTLPLSNQTCMTAVIDITIDDFLMWFESELHAKLS